ncbi:maker767 [Drosophila busckii]|uniref:Maker767 n=1 Tax=Drosophila busckii TaxID=30019 RepID=A0A0M4EKU2_DROBS|nr:maker767 [Drosophila busckii]
MRRGDVNVIELFSCAQTSKPLWRSLYASRQAAVATTTITTRNKSNYNRMLGHGSGLPQTTQPPTTTTTTAAAATTKLDNNITM